MDFWEQQAADAQQVKAKKVTKKSPHVSNVRYANCGYDCYTIAGDDGRWGWQYLDLVPETRQVSNGDATEEITRTAFCFVKLGAVSIGECEEW